MSARSFFFDFLMPQARPLAWNPMGAVTPPLKRLISVKEALGLVKTSQDVHILNGLSRRTLAQVVDGRDDHGEPLRGVHAQADVAEIRMRHVFEFGQGAPRADLHKE